MTLPRVFGALFFKNAVRVRAVLRLSLTALLCLLFIPQSSTLAQVSATFDGAVVVGQDPSPTCSAGSAGALRYKTAVAGNGRWIAAGDYNGIYTSTNGTSWTLINMTEDIYDIDYDTVTGKWIAVSSYNYVFSSLNGTTWAAPIEVDNPAYDHFSVTHDGLGRWTMLSSEYPSDAVIYTSTNGTSWTSPQTITNAQLFDATHDGIGRWIAVGDPGKIYTSTNGTAWSQVLSDPSPIFNDVAYDGTGRWIAAASFNITMDYPGPMPFSGAIYTSTDGLTWTSTYTTAASALYGAVYGGGRWTVVGTNGKIYTSTNGTSWSETQDVGDAAFSKVAYDGTGRWTAITGSVVAVGNPPPNEGQAGSIYTSTNGTSWTLVTNIKAPPGLYSIASNGSGQWRASSNETIDGEIYASTGDGKYWHRVYDGSASSLSITKMHYGNGRWTTGSSAGERIIGSTDGNTWTIVNSAAGATGATSATYGAGPGRWVMVGEGKIWHSLTGIVWTAASGGAGDFMGVAYDPVGVRFSAVTTNGRIYTSTNATTWTLAQTISGASFGDVEHDGVGRWNAVGVGGIVYTSTNGTTWTLQATLASDGLTDIHYAAGRWVTVGDDSTGAFTSTDGLTWTKVLTPTGSDEVVGVSYNASNTTWVAVANMGYSGNISAIYTSTNGTTWTRNLTGLVTLEDVAYGAGRWTIVGTGTGLIYGSTDGTTWSMVADLGPTVSLYGVTYGGGRWTATGKAGTTGKIYTSTNGTTWTETYSGSGGVPAAVAYDGSGRWTAASNGLDGRIYTSTNGTGWSVTQTDAGSVRRGVAFGGALWTLVGQEGEIWSSSNGTSWTKIYNIGIQMFKGVATNGTGRWTAVGSGGKIYASTNGTTWAEVTDVGADILTGIAYGGGRWNASAYDPTQSNGRVYTSTDGVAWSPVAVTGNPPLYAMGYDGVSRWITTSTSGRIYTSTNGTTWALAQDTASSDAFVNVAYAPDGVVGIPLEYCNGSGWIKFGQ